MNPSFHLRSKAVFLLALTSALVIAACGGGVDTGGTGMTASYSSGPITGFGSVVVNDVHFDETTAKVVDADGASFSANDLKLGMTVDVDADGIVPGSGTTTATAKASQFRFGSELSGAISALDKPNTAFTVLGQTVRVSGETVFDERLTAGYSGLAVNQTIVLYGLYDPASNSYRATRIERAGSLSEYRLRGLVSQLDTTAKTFKIGGATLTYSAVDSASVPSTLANGNFVRLRLRLSPDGSGRWVVSSFGANVSVPDRKEAAVKGVVNAFTSNASFSVNGVMVNAAAASFPDGTSNLRLGARVEAQGSLVAGVLVATQVNVETDSQVDQRQFELKGSVTSLNSANKTFVVRGNTVSYAGTGVAYSGGTVADLANGKAVEVKGVLSPDRTQLTATQIKFSN